MIAEPPLGTLHTPPCGNLDKAVDLKTETVVSLDPMEHNPPVQFVNAQDTRKVVSDDCAASEICEQITSMQDDDQSTDLVNDLEDTNQSADKDLFSQECENVDTVDSRDLHMNVPVVEANQDDSLQCDLVEDHATQQVKGETEELGAKLETEPQVEAITDSCADVPLVAIQNDVDEGVNTSPSSRKMKFEYVNTGGKFSLQVTTDATAKPQEPTEREAIPTTPKSKSKRINSGDKTKPQRTKSTDKPIGGKTRNKVMSPRSPQPGNNPSAPQKPLMDLRHILKKYEKKKEPIQQTVQQVDFYGSLSAIPFLNPPKKSEEEKPTQKAKTKKRDEPNKTNVTNRGTESSLDGISVTEDEILVEKPRLPTKEEIVVTAEYNEEQLKLWKSMTALDCSRDTIQRPQEMLPLRPVPRKEKKVSSPHNSAVRAFSRPDDWLSRPEWNASQKSYRSASSKEQLDDDILVMEPEE